MSDWVGLYRDSWQGVIVPEAFAHPAKFSRALIRHIYDHLAEEDWLHPGDTVLDPFGGVALGALDCMRIGCHWMGCELEERFVALGQQNIALWNARFSSLPGWGTARILQGDSRRLSEIVGEAGAVISSPPYIEGLGHGGGKCYFANDTRGTAQAMLDGYSSSPSNLGNMKDAGFAAAVGSPPFAGAQQTDRRGKEHPYNKGKFSAGSWGKPTDYDNPDSPGQLAAMPEGTIDAVVSSPPYVSGGHHPDQTGAWNTSEKFDGRNRGLTKDQAGYGATEGQMGRMPEGAFDGVVSSPPWEDQEPSHAQGGSPSTKCLEMSSLKNRVVVQAEYGGEDNLGNSSGPTFWSASREILEQVHAVLRPGAHAVWVLKGFVRRGVLVDFPGQWQALCEAVGFRTVHVHRAWLVEEHGTQGLLGGGEKLHRTERKSFFRRLAEKKGSPAIDWETVLCTERLPLAAPGEREEEQLL